MCLISVIGGDCGDRSFVESLPSTKGLQSRVMSFVAEKCFICRLIPLMNYRTLPACQSPDHVPSHYTAYKMLGNIRSFKTYVHAVIITIFCLIEMVHFVLG